MYDGLQRSLPHSPRCAPPRDAGSPGHAPWREVWLFCPYNTQHPPTHRLPKHFLQPTITPKLAHAPHQSNLSPLSSRRSHLTPRTARCSSNLLPTLSLLLYLKNTWSGSRVGQLMDCMSSEQACCVRHTASRRTPVIEESVVPGTLAGELSVLAGLPCNATVVTEHQRFCGT